MTKLQRSFVWGAIGLLSAYSVVKVREFLVARAGGTATVAGRVKEFGPVVEGRFREAFEKAGVPYPPARVVLAGFKQERRLEVYAAGPQGSLRFIRAYDVLGTSGHLGPKLREGDGQVPEGLYGIEYLNPNSAYHLSLKISYPNDFDRERGADDGRKELGGDIMIHGRSSSAGCLAMGDPAAEDLFVLAALTGIKHVSVVISPVDFRSRELPGDVPPGPNWTGVLYPQIREALKGLPSR